MSIRTRASRRAQFMQSWGDRRSQRRVRREHSASDEGADFADKSRAHGLQTFEDGRCADVPAPLGDQLRASLARGVRHRCHGFHGQGRDRARRHPQPALGDGLRVANGRRSATLWHIEFSSVNLLLRRGWDFERLKVGEQVTCVGNPSAAGKAEMYMWSIVLPTAPSSVDEPSAMRATAKRGRLLRRSRRRPGSPIAGIWLPDASRSERFPARTAVHARRQAYRRRVARESRPDRGRPRQVLPSAGHAVVGARWRELPVEIVVTPSR